MHSARVPQLPDHLTDYLTFVLVSKRLRVNNAALKFIKSASVFKEWIEDTNVSLAKAFQHDMKYWKIDKITDDYS